MGFLCAKEYFKSNVPVKYTYEKGSTRCGERPTGTGILKVKISCTGTGAQTMVLI
jgi:hypothetical protein